MMQAVAEYPRVDAKDLQPGWYWYSGGGVDREWRVEKVKKWSDGSISVHSESQDVQSVDRMHGEWRGPIPMPPKEQLHTDESLAEWQIHQDIFQKALQDRIDRMQSEMEELRQRSPV